MPQQDMRKVLLEIVKGHGGRGTHCQTNTILKEAAERLGIPKQDEDRVYALLTAWYDLFRTGILAWGYNLDNSGPPWCHCTERGRAALKSLSHDPSNPDGYSANLKALMAPNPVAMSYAEEALMTYNHGCNKATAVLVGCAAESMLLQVRDALCQKLTRDGTSPIPRDLKDWRPKKVLGAVKTQLEKYKTDMPSALNEAVEAHWSGLTHQIRVARNDAGHPKSVDPVTPDTVHANLLMLPVLAKLVADLLEWMRP